MEKDAFYFPHFCNARHDRKIKRMRKELGVEGYGIYFMLLEVLREQKNFIYPVEDLDLLAEEFGTSEQKLRTVVCNYKLFEVDDTENFFSIKFIEYLKPYLTAKQRNRVSGIKGNLIKYGYATKEQLKSLTDAEIVELNESKEMLLVGGDSGGDSGGDRLAIASKVNKVNKVNKVKEIKEDIYREQDHLLLTETEKLSIEEKYKRIDVDFYVDSIFNFAENKKYKSLNLTMQNWIKRDIKKNGDYAKLPIQKKQTDEYIDPFGGF